MALRDSEVARRQAGAIECRQEPLRLGWHFTDLIAGDAHVLDCHFAGAIRIADNPADRRMFFETFLSGKDSISTEAIAEHFSAAFRNALSGIASTCKAADAVNGPGPQSWVNALLEAAKPIAFACGLESLPPFQLDLTSPTLQRQKLDQIALARAAEKAAGQLQQMDRAAELLKRFQSLRAAAPDLPAGKLLEQIAPDDRGATLQTLLLASSHEQKARSLWAVAGPYLIRIDPHQVPPHRVLIELPATVGPLRSVQPGQVENQPRLLIGGRSGVMIASMDSPGSADVYLHSGLDSPLGFNRVVCDGRSLWASHGEAGIVRWKLGEKEKPAWEFQERALPAAPLNSGVNTGPRNLELLNDSRLIYSVGNQIIIRQGEDRIQLPCQDASDVIAIIPIPGTMIIVHQSGTLIRLDRTSRQIMDVRHRSARLTAAAAMPWIGDVRILLASEEGPIGCIGLDDPLVSEYLSAHRGVKMLSATADLVAAVSPDRQRIILWASWDGQRPIGEIHITAQTRHRIADIELA